MNPYKFWKVQWIKNEMVGISDGKNFVTIPEKEWLRIKLENEFNINKEEEDDDSDTM